jgi:type IV secretion system protein VirD4
MKSNRINALKKILTAIGIMTIACYVGGFVFNCLVKYNFTLKFNIYLLAHGDTFKYTGFLMAAALLIYGVYYYRHYWLKATNRLIRGRKQDSDVRANLENARFQTDTDLRKNFVYTSFETLRNKDISGVPVKAVQGSTYDIHLCKPAHALIIGTTGSGKTTTYINPTVQILAECGNKASMLISDPKGELYNYTLKALPTVAMT